MTSTYSFTKLVVHDLETMSDFYCQAYNLKQFERVQADIGGDPIDEIMLGIDSAYGPGSIMLLQFVGQPAPTPGAVILGFQTDDLEGLVESVIEAGGALHTNIKESDVASVRVAFTRDPEGNLAECVQMMN